MQLPKSKQGYYFLIVGIIIIIASLFLPLFSTCKEGLDDYINVNVSGLESFIYYLSLLFIIIIASLGFFGKQLIAILIVSGIGGTIILFMTWIGTAGWGQPCGHSPTGYFFFLCIGHILVILASIIHSAVNVKVNKTENDLLDQ